ncbi:TRAP transporter small permease [Amorphus sp. 3PC139-8]|uniref:TRAP transporter small permease n=1 Tax=Amorphus sp. 3PC139-8 TaxID=2735676 RepID=UPI00345D898B
MAIAAEHEREAKDRRSVTCMGRRLGGIVETVLGLVLIAIVLINVANAAGRYLLQAAITGTDELMVFAMVFIVVAGAVLALVRRAHIAIDLLPTYANARLRVAIYCFHDLVTLAATAYAAHASWIYVQKIARLGTESMTLGIPMVFPHGALFLGFCAMAVVAGIYLVRDAATLLGLLPASTGKGGKR